MDRVKTQRILVPWIWRTVKGSKPYLKPSVPLKSQTRPCQTRQLPPPPLSPFLHPLSSFIPDDGPVLKLFAACTLRPFVLFAVTSTSHIQAFGMNLLPLVSYKHKAFSKNPLFSIIFSLNLCSYTSLQHSIQYGCTPTFPTCTYLPSTSSARPPTKITSMLFTLTWIHQYFLIVTRCLYRIARFEAPRSTLITLVCWRFLRFLFHFGNFTMLNLEVNNSNASHHKHTFIPSPHNGKHCGTSE